MPVLVLTSSNDAARVTKYGSEEAVQAAIQQEFIDSGAEKAMPSRSVSRENQTLRSEGPAPPSPAHLLGSGANHRGLYNNLVAGGVLQPRESVSAATTVRSESDGSECLDKPSQIEARNEQSTSNAELTVETF